jgi:hypothetical protein
MSAWIIANKVAFSWFWFGFAAGQGLELVFKLLALTRSKP